ncbi:conserved hypothetical protein [Burkholderia cenocepacia]|nr:conserved hypothetical protein [Burkholderia cenocepacia]
MRVVRSVALKQGGGLAMADAVNLETAVARSRGRAVAPANPCSTGSVGAVRRKVKRYHMSYIRQMFCGN